jgi:hypothetical protein
MISMKTSHTELLARQLLSLVRHGSPVWLKSKQEVQQIQRSGFDSRCCQIFREVAGLERGPLSLVSTVEGLLGRKKVEAPV